MRLFAILGCLWVIVSAVPHVVAVDFSNPRGIDITTDYDGRLRLGDAKGQRIDLQAIPFDQRYKFTPSKAPLPKDERAEIPVVGSKPLLTTTAAYFDSDRLSITLRFFATVGFVILSALTLWRFPTRRNLGFFLFVVGANPVALNARLSLYPSATSWLVDVIISDLFTCVAFLGIVDFAVRGEYRGWFALRWDKALPVFAPLYCLTNTWPDVATLAYGIPSEFTNRIGFAAQFGITVYGGAALIVAATRTPPAVRRPMIATALAYWVGVGGYLLAYALLFSSIFPPLSDTISNALQASALFLFFSIIAGSTIIRRLVMLKTTLQRRISIAVVVQLLVTAVWFAIIKWLEVFGHREGPSSILTLGVLEVAGSVFWERVAVHSVESQREAVRAARREALEACRETLEAAKSEEDLDRALLSIGKELQLECVAVYKAVGNEFHLVAVEPDQAAAMPTTVTSDDIIGALRRHSDVRLPSRNIFNCGDVLMVHGFALRMQQMLLGFVVTSAHTGGEQLYELDISAIKLLISRAENNYERFAKPKTL